MKRARGLVNAHPEVVESHWVVGESTPRVYYNVMTGQERNASYAGAFVDTRSAEATHALLPRLQRELADAFPDARVLASAFEQGPPFDAPIEVRVIGPDLDTLRRLGYGRVHLRTGDGYRGWPEAAPFDAVIVTAAPGKVPAPLLEQLAPGGRLVIPVGTRDQMLEVHRRTRDGIVVERTVPVRFVPMTGEAQRSP